MWLATFLGQDNRSFLVFRSSTTCDRWRIVARASVRNEEALAVAMMLAADKREKTFSMASCGRRWRCIWSKVAGGGGRVQREEVSRREGRVEMRACDGPT